LQLFPTSKTDTRTLAV